MKPTFIVRPPRRPGLPMLRFLTLVLLGVFCWAGSLHAQEKQALTFEHDIRPLLKAHCFECHGEGKKLKGGLDVRLRRFLVQGGDQGPSVLPGQSKKSSLIERVTQGDMPPGKRKLTPAEIALLSRWIDQGAPTAKPEPEKLPVGFHFTEEDRNFWFFQPIRRIDPPRVKDEDKVRTPIDRFLLGKLEAKGLSFSPEADRRTLVRRAYFDLLGLPPTPEEIREFLEDASPQAYERLIDRLLASPHYGERYGRHWLDVAGYADSEGFTGQDPVRPNMYRYRDYVIRAFNEDKPFDQFILEQLAGDELLQSPYQNAAARDWDKLIATGFLRLAPDGTGQKDVDIKQASNQTVADTLQIVGSSFMGLTLHCAQCHNHRYDPISQVDYYRLRAIFEPAFNTQDWRTPAQRDIPVFTAERRKELEKTLAEAKKIDQIRIEKVQKYVKEIFARAYAKVPPSEKPAVDKALKKAGAARSDEEKALLAKHKGLLVDAANVVTFDEKIRQEVAALMAQAQNIRAVRPLSDNLRALTEIPGTIPPTYFLDRGDPDQTGEEQQPGHLAILAGLNLPEIPVKDPKLPTTGRRLAFARALVSPQNPLTPRVLVNRFWMHHFGRGIVASPSDFGRLGELPSHPELLDWLASEFQAAGWSLKKLHRLIMTSTAYRQSSFRTPELQELDPENQLLGRMSIRRLEAETVRDAMLTAAGKLNPKAFGPPVPIKPDEAGQIVVGVDTNDNAGRPTGKFVPLNGEEFRRSIYVQVRRSKPLSMLEVFDAPLLNPNCDCRNASTVTPQSLLMMNNKDVIDLAELFAQKVEQEAGPEWEPRLRRAFLRAFAAEPTAPELERSLAFVKAQADAFRQAKTAAPDHQALANFCQALFSSNRFLYVD